MRRRVAILAATGMLMLLPATAHADVLQIDSGGARWIAGGINQPGNRPLAQGPEVPVEAMVDPAANAQAIPSAYAAKVRELAARYDLSPALIEAVVWQESRWQAGARSPAGAQGLAQLMPGTAQELGVDADDPMANLEGGARYLREQLDRFGGDLEKALAAYDAGPGRVSRARGVPDIPETKRYVAAIIGRLADHTRR